LPTASFAEVLPNGKPLFTGQSGYVFFSDDFCIHFSLRILSWYNNTFTEKIYQNIKTDRRGGSSLIAKR